MTRDNVIPFFDTDATHQDPFGKASTSSPDSRTSSPNSGTSSLSPPTSSLLADVNFLSLFIANTKLIRPIGDDGDEVCAELSHGTNKRVLCRITDPLLLDHANALARTYSNGDLSCFLGQPDFTRLQDFCRAQITADMLPQPVHKRLAWLPDDEAIWLDLSRPDGLCVRICRTHWNLEQPPQPIFLRGRTQRPLPEPVSSDDGYGALCRMLPPMSETDIKLLIGTMLGMMIPSNFLNPANNDAGFAYPVLIITGDPGAGKSTLAKLIKTLLDNEVTTTTTRPSKVEDLWVQAQYSQILSYDNIRTVWDGLSDGICALTTNAALTRRSLYTNRNISILRGHCAIILNGINPALAQQDLLDRAVTITLRRFDRFNAAARTDAELGLALGYLCDLMVRGLANYTTAASPGSARISLVAKIATGAEPFGCPESFNDLLVDNQTTALTSTREHDVVIDALYDLMGGTREWRGTYKELLGALALKTDLNVTASADWPKSPHKLSAFLREHTRLARQLAIDITPGPKHNNGRIVTVSRLPGFTYRKDRE